MRSFITVLLGTAVCLALIAPARAAELPSIDEEIAIPGWWIVGPFINGMREAGTDMRAFDRDAPSAQLDLLAPSFPSALVPGGKARWSWYQPGDNGLVVVDYPAVSDESMELVYDEWGFAGGMTVGYARTEVEISGGDRRALVDIRHAGGFELNGIPYSGDAYGFGWAKTPVVLREGNNEIRITVGSRQKFSFRLLPVENDVQVLAGKATLPDIVRGQSLPLLVGLSVINNTGDWLDLTSIGVAGNPLYSSATTGKAVVAPYGLQTLAIELNPALDAAPADLEENFELKLGLDFNGTRAIAELSLQVRDPDQSRRVTFTSAMDESVQYYALMPPSGFSADHEYALIFSLHGAGVEATSQVNAYRQKDFAFIVAPTNRRPFGFDWQDWGRLDMLEVLNHVLANNPVNEDRVHLTGHSMGGHGTWINALTFPDKWASAAPSAGWTTFDLYVPFFLRKNLILGDPRANLIWELAMREEDTLALAENGINLPFRALEGGADDNVPPQQPRLMAQTLIKMGCDVEYREVPGKGHWWGIPGTDVTECVDNPWFEDMWRNEVRNNWPQKVVFRTHNYSINDGAYWVSDVRPGNAYQDMVVRATVVDDSSIEVLTSNVLHFRLELGPELVTPGPVSILVNGRLHELDTSKSAEFELDLLHWREGFRVPRKTAGNYGPWKQVLMQPFDVVYGTTGDAAQTEFNLALARLYAHKWWYRGNGSCRIFADSNFDAAAPTRNLVLVGGPECNAVTALAADELPIVPAEHGLLMYSEDFSGTDLTYKYVYPNPLGSAESLLLVQGGTSLDAMKRLPSAMCIYAGAGFPDWMVWDDEYKLRGIGGVLASGFFDMYWEFDGRNSFINFELLNRLGMLNQK